MQKVTGSDAWYQKDKLGTITISDEGEVQGAINPLRVVTQAVFYARASKIEPTFLPDITTELLYRLLEWTYWYVALTEQENSHALSTVAPLAALIIQILKNAKTEDIDDDVVATIDDVVVRGWVLGGNFDEAIQLRNGFLRTRTRTV